MRRGPFNQVWLPPIVCVATGQVLKAEALLRWDHPVHRMIPPSVFIPIAEEPGIILDIGDWVFREAAATAKRWLDLHRDAGLDGMPQVSINVSPRQFLHGETFEAWIDLLALLRQAGIQLALGDFGTGYLAMAYLKRFNIDYLKIDRS